MQKLISEEQVLKVASFNGINVYRIKTQKFKTNSINIFFHDNLRRENVTKTALVPAILRRGCGSFPTFQDIALHLEDMYGASFDCGVNKKGENHIVQFYIEYVSDKYTGESLNLFEKSFDLLYEVITNPVLEDGIFNKDYVEQEKENLKKLIESRVNDKGQYALEKCFETMCSDEPFGLNEYGFIEDLSAINASNLYSHYKSFVETFPMHVYITGDIEEEKINYAINKLSGLGRGKIKEIEKTVVLKTIKDVKKAEEKMNVSQGKLTLGFRTNTCPGDKDYYTLLVFSTILGGGMHSKLFQNVREKESLAYYVFSRLEKFKGLMVISCGIEVDNKDKAIEIILKQLDEIKIGNISDNEYVSSINSIETGVKSLKDSQLHIVDFYLSQTIANTTDDFDKLIENIKRVTKQDVISLSEKIKLDTIFFLTSSR